MGQASSIASALSTTAARPHKKRQPAMHSTAEYDRALLRGKSGKPQLAFCR